jgi:hypothetical protein
MTQQNIIDKLEVPEGNRKRDREGVNRDAAEIVRKGQ